jgi:glycosyltransferase involved in cell wall biosynthesis
MVVIFPGQEVMFLARLLTRKPIVFDALTSHYGGYILDRKRYVATSWRAKYYRFLDTWSCRFANLVLLDTNTHIDFFVHEFNLPREKFLRVFVGTDDTIFYPRGTKKEMDAFFIHFHGHFIPLQGVEIIIRAAHILKNEDIVFQIIGKGQDYAKVRKLADDFGLKNIIWIDSVRYEELPEYIAKADVCLGGFGTTQKAQVVSMNKLFEYMACGKAIITGDAPSVRELLIDGETTLFCERTPEGLAAKIMMLKSDSALVSRLSTNVRKSFLERYTPTVMSVTLADGISHLQGTAL